LYAIIGTLQEWNALPLSSVVVECVGSYSFGNGPARVNDHGMVSTRALEIMAGEMLGASPWPGEFSKETATSSDDEITTHGGSC